MVAILSIFRYPGQMAIYEGGIGLCFAKLLPSFDIIVDCVTFYESVPIPNKLIESLLRAISEALFGMC